MVDSDDNSQEQSTDKRAPALGDLLDSLYQWLVRHLGLTLAKRLMLGGLIAAAVVSCGWANREVVTTLPVVSSLVTTVQEGPLPIVRADSNTVLIADLDDDTNHEMRDFFVAWMRQHGINSAPLGRTLHVSTAPTIESVRAAGVHAAEYLVKTNAKVVLWGRVHHLGNRLVPELYLAVAGREETPSDDPFYAMDDNQLVSPRLQRDVANALLLVTAAEVAQAEQQQRAQSRFRSHLLAMVQQ